MELSEALAKRASSESSSDESQSESSSSSSDGDDGDGSSENDGKRVPSMPLEAPSESAVLEAIESIVARAAIVGDKRTGKSTLMRRSKARLAGRKGVHKEGEGEMSQQDDRTVAFTVMPPCEMASNEVLYLEMCDASAPRTEQRVEPAVVSRANIVVVVFDLTRRDTLESVDRWVEITKGHCSVKDRAGLLIGTKRDIVGGRTVSEELALRTAARLHMNYFEMDSIGHDDDVDQFCVYIARTALYLHRYRLQVELAGKKGCPAWCSSKGQPRPHRHVFRECSLSSSVEYVDVPPHASLSDPIRQPSDGAVVHPGWIRSLLFRLPEALTAGVEALKGPTSARDLLRRSLANPSDPLANRLLPYDRKVADAEAVRVLRWQIPTNEFSRPNERFDEKTSLLTVYEPFKSAAKGALHVVASCMAMSSEEPRENATSYVWNAETPGRKTARRSLLCTDDLPVSALSDRSSMNFFEGCDQETEKKEKARRRSLNYEQPTPRLPPVALIGLDEDIPTPETEDSRANE